MLVYTANIDISTIRLVLSEVAQDKEWGIATIDIKTAFLNAPMPTNEERVYVTPPAIYVHFGMVKPGTIWRVDKAIYGLRQSPRLWGKERDKQLRLMRSTLRNERFKFLQSSIDVALWTLVRDDDEFFDHNRKVAGYLLTYVDDF